MPAASRLATALLLAAPLALALSPAPVLASWIPGDTPSPPSRTANPELTAAGSGALPAPPHEALLRPDPCALPRTEGLSILDRVQRGVYRSVCSTALWFDGMFGQELSYQEIEETYGWVRARASWDEIDGFDLSGTLRVRVTLPQMERRLNAFIGQVSEEEFKQETGRDFPRLPEPFQDTREEDWLLGLGYSPVSDSTRRLSFGVGVDLRLPPDPFVRARYRRHFFFSQSTLARWRQIAFWRSTDGLGTTTILDLEQLFGQRSLVRLRGIATVSGSAEGVDWRSDLTVYQDLRRGGAMAYQALIDGETDAPVTVWRYGLLLNYRRRIIRDWLFLEVRPGFYWRRLERGLPRERVPQIGFGLELRFGERYRGGGPTVDELGPVSRRRRAAELAERERSSPAREPGAAPPTWHCPLSGPW